MNEHSKISIDIIQYFTESIKLTGEFIKKHDCTEAQLYKNICLSVVSRTRQDIVLVSIPLRKRVSFEKVAPFLHVEPAQIETAQEDRLQTLIGYPKDLVPFLGLHCKHLLDNGALKYPFIISGAGEKDRYVKVDRSFYMNSADLTLGDFIE